MERIARRERSEAARPKPDFITHFLIRLHQMKFFILFFAFFGSACVAMAQNVHIPDANFKAYLLNNKEINTNGDEEIQVSEAAAFMGEINCKKMDITDLIGIEAFVKLTKLNCSQNKIGALDVSKNVALTDLDCSENKISALDVSQNTDLKFLVCWLNQLTSLDVSQNTDLRFLECWLNQLSMLDA
jgi:hypothetical protein